MAANKTWQFQTADSCEGDIVAASQTTMVLKTDGTLWAWGDNASGQLGDGTNEDKIRPVKIGTATDYRLGDGGYHNRSWGRPEDKRLALGVGIECIRAARRWHKHR